MIRTSSTAVSEPSVIHTLKYNGVVCPPIPPTRKAFPAVWMRSGTSKGLFVHRKDLPTSTKLWEPILLSAMGSAGASAKQIDGMGGATSTTSKVAVIGPSQSPNIDVDYTFIQVAPDQAKIDMTGNCGNIASGVGPFALDEGLVKAKAGQKEVSMAFHTKLAELDLTDSCTKISIRILNTNTGQTIVETIQVGPDGKVQEDGDYEIPGVSGKSSPIRVAFLNPGGSMTGRMFPTGTPRETLNVFSASVGAFSVRASLVDAANPFVLVDSTSMSIKDYPSWPDPNDPAFLSVVEDIRRAGAVRFGLAPNLEAAGQVRGTPKIAFLSPVAQDDMNADIRVLAFSMGKPHPSLQLTGAVCIGAAMSIHGTVAWDLVAERGVGKLPKNGMSVEGQRIAPPLPMGIRHPTGVIHAETVLKIDREGVVHVDEVAVLRTARRLFEGNVFYRT